MTLVASGTSKLNFKETTDDRAKRETRTSADKIGRLNCMMIYIIYSKCIYDKHKNNLRSHQVDIHSGEYKLSDLKP